MANSRIIEQLRHMANKKEIDTDQAIPLMLAGLADIAENQVDLQGLASQVEANAKAVESNAKTLLAITKAQTKFFSLATQVEVNKEDIADGKKRSNIYDGIVGFLAIIGAALAALVNKQ